MRNSEISKERILNAAEKVFTEKGLYGARVDEIAAEADINKRMLYAYYGNKESLYTETLKTVYSRLADVESKIDITEDPREEIKNYVRSYFDFLYDNPSFVKLIMWENLNEANYIKSAGAPGLKNFSVTRIKYVLAKGRQIGYFREDIADEEIIFALNMICFSYFSNVHTMPMLLDIDLENRELMNKRSAFVAEMILNMLKK